MRKRAKHFGFKFSGRKNFRVPREVKILSKYQSLKIPDEHGAFIDFVSIFLEDAYNLSYYRKFEISSILDIGGNLGFYSMAARSYFPVSIIHLYEPNPTLNEFIDTNIQDLNISYYKEAVGNSSDPIQLDFRGDSNQTRSDFTANGNIPQVPLSEAINRLGGKVDLAKIDCEGAEWEMLKNPEPWKSINHLTIEYHLWDGHTDNEINNKLIDLDFEIIEQTPMGDYGHIQAKNKFLP